jgi:type I restriction enzyme S subunit
MFGDVMKNPKQFPIKLLEELCEEIIDCPHSTPNYVEYNTEFPCIRTTELDNGAINWSKMKYLNYEGYIERTKRLVPKEGDIIYGREGSFGEAAIVPVGCKMSLGQRVMLFRPNSNLINSKFLHAVVRSNGVYKQALRVTSGSTVGHINVKDIKKFKLIVAPLGLQNQFAERVQAIEEQKTQAQASLVKAEELFASLLQKSLKGELV